jgi:hypothetical protein
LSSLVILLVLSTRLVYNQTLHINFLDNKTCWKIAKISIQWFQGENNIWDMVLFIFSYYCFYFSTVILRVFVIIRHYFDISFICHRSFPYSRYTEDEPILSNLNCIGNEARLKDCNGFRLDNVTSCTWFAAALCYNNKRKSDCFYIFFYQILCRFLIQALIWEQSGDAHACNLY